jgi:hypothetical protein
MSETPVMLSISSTPAPQLPTAAPQLPTAAPQLPTAAPQLPTAPAPQLPTAPAPQLPTAPAPQLPTAAPQLPAPQLPAPQLPTAAPQLPAPQLPATQPSTDHVDEVSRMITYENFDVNRLEISPLGVQQKTVEKGGSKIPYSEIPLIYRYAPTVVDDLYLEGPKLSIKGGIRMSVLDGQKVYSIMTRLDMNNSDHAKFCMCLMQIYQRTAEFIETSRHKLSNTYARFQAAHAPMAYKQPIFFPTDEMKNPITNTYATIFFKLMKGGYFGDTTLFIGADGKQIDWSLLGLTTNVEFEMVPVVRIQKIYLGAKPSLQIKLFSAVVISLKPGNTTSMQIHTLEKYREQADQFNAGKAEVSNLVSTINSTKLTSNPPLMETSGGTNNPPPYSTQVPFSGAPTPFPASSYMPSTTFQ